MLRPWLVLALSISLAATALVARAVAWLLLALALVALVGAAALAWRRMKRRAIDPGGPAAR